MQVHVTWFDSSRANLLRGERHNHPTIALMMPSCKNDVCSVHRWRPRAPGRIAAIICQQLARTFPSINFSHARNGCCLQWEVGVQSGGEKSTCDAGSASRAVESKVRYFNSCWQTLPTWLTACTLALTLCNPLRVRSIGSLKSKRQVETIENKDSEKADASCCRHLSVVSTFSVNNFFQPMLLHFDDWGGGQLQRTIYCALTCYGFNIRTTAVQ